MHQKGLPSLALWMGIVALSWSLNTQAQTPASGTVTEAAPVATVVAPDPAPAPAPAAVATPAPTTAPTPAPVSAPVLPAPTKPFLAKQDSINSADTAWMMTSTALVLLMTLPGIALFYGGMVRKKSVINTMASVVAVAALLSLL